jgi:hypothetical protein
MDLESIEIVLSKKEDEIFYVNIIYHPPSKPCHPKACKGRSGRVKIVMKDGKVIDEKEYCRIYKKKGEE